MKRLVMMVLVLVAVGGTTEVNAQSFLKKLGKKVENAAKNAIERNAERKTEEAVDKVFEGDFGKGKKDKNNNGNNNNADEVYDNGNGDATAQSGKQKGKTAEMSWNKFDFVAGDEIMFEDNQANEQMGEFPSMWDLIEGNAEIASMDNVKCINLVGETKIKPLMKDANNYLPEKYTVEFDFYYFDKARWKYYENYQLIFLNSENNESFSMRITADGYSDDMIIRWDWLNTSGNKSEGEQRISNSAKDEWYHCSLSFNKRALKVYINQTRVINIPNASQASQFYVFGSGSNQALDLMYIKNIRLAQGAVPLYDRMMSDGKFITYGITFDVGKATIKPESMGEINRIVTLMTENPDLKFSVEGHTDSTGNAASNQTLSEQRSQAIVAKLVELGIAQDRLTAVGKGQNSPIADNNTDEGRAKNRRVEFVKM